MKRFALILLAVIIGVAASIIVETMLNSTAPGLRGSEAVRWIGNLVSILVALAIFNMIDRRRAS